ncbi:MAG: Cytochrome c oxidase polypeptide [Myxococcales bacterium]|nr:Cytochrome c oxidase polypeptide [Myxococcales bacterium]
MNELMRNMLFLPVQASTMSTHIDYLHYFVIITTMVVSTLIGGAALGFYVKYRWKGRIGAKGEPVYTTFLGEALIIGVPAFFFLLWFAIGYRDFVRLQSPPPNAQDVYVMGKQWMWKFSYPDGGPSGTNVLRVPANRPIRLLMTSRDVIHSFFVPAFRTKQDVLPGRYTQSWFEATKPGRYPVYCTEMCGTGHSTMRAEVVVMEPQEFDKWYAEEKSHSRAKQRDGRKTNIEDRDPHATMIEMGRQLAESAGCFKCHSTDGSPHIGPTWLDMYMRKETLQGGQVQVADEAYITESMMEPKLKQVQGYQLVMPSYRGRLEGPESAAIVEYIKSLRSDGTEPVRDKGPQFDIKNGQVVEPGTGSTEVRTGGMQ